MSSTRSGRSAAPPGPSPDPADPRAGQAEQDRVGRPGSAGRGRWVGLGVLAAALAMIVLDGTIVGVALPTIIADLRLDLIDAQWVNSLYAVVFAALLLTAGRLGDRFGRRRLLLIGVVVFVLGSAAAALAGGVVALLLARAGQGVGGALILPSTLSTVNATFRGKDRAAAFGVWGAVMSGAAAIGPLLGGWLTEVSSWRWIFWVNLPIGVAVVLAALRWVPETRDSDRHRVDLPGPVLSALGFGLLVFGLIEGNALGWWTAQEPLQVLGLTWPADAPVSAAPVAIILGLLAVAGFVVVERRLQADALLDLNLFRLPTFAWGNLTAGVVAAGEFSLIFVLPLYLSMSLHLSAISTGLVLSSMALGAFVAGASARHLAGALGAPAVVVVGLALEVVGAAVTAVAVGQLWSPWWLALTLLPYGLGLGLASAQLTSTVLRDVPVSSSGAASAAQSTVRQVGSALGSALGGTVLAVSLGTHVFFGVDPERFASATSDAVWAAAGALLLGLVGAVAVARHSGPPVSISTSAAYGGTGTAA